MYSAHGRLWKKMESCVVIWWCSLQTTGMFHFLKVWAIFCGTSKKFGPFCVELWKKKDFCCVLCMTTVDEAWIIFSLSIATTLIKRPIMLQVIVVVQGISRWLVSFSLSFGSFTLLYPSFEPWASIAVIKETKSPSYFIIMGCKYPRHSFEVCLSIYTENERILKKIRTAEISNLKVAVPVWLQAMQNYMSVTFSAFQC